jgi:hypothetical protein
VRRHRARWALIVAATLGVACILAVTAAALTPTDPDAAHPAYAALNLPAAWDVTTGSAEIVVAVVDSGVDPTHPDLAGSVLPGYDFVDRDADASPVDGHGTAVAGAVGSRADNGIGGVGACFRCTILPLQVMGANGVALNVYIAEAIDYAVDRGAAVVNVSLYGPSSPPRLERAIQRARTAGVLVVAAAGNEGGDAPRYPAATPGAVSVGASTIDGRRAAISNHGSWVKFAAPECAPIALLGGGSGVGCGTSVSTPLVAGIVALMRAQAPYAGAAELEASLVRASRPVRDTRYGVPDAAAALRDIGSPRPRLRPIVLGQAAVGGRLEAWSGLWIGSGVEVTYAWQRCDRAACVSIPGATDRIYTPVAADAGSRLQVTATAAQIEPATSARTTAVESRPRALARPSIAGWPRVGARLLAGPGRWSGANLDFAFQWQRCRARCTDTATGRAYRVSPRDRGFQLRVRVQASNSVGAGVAVSERTRPVP